MTDDTTRRRIFWLLQRLTSFALWKRKRDAFATFAHEYENAVKTLPEDDPEPMPANNLPNDDASMEAAIGLPTATCSDCLRELMAVQKKGRGERDVSGGRMTKLNFGTIGRCSVDLDTATLLCVGSAMQARSGRRSNTWCPREPARFSGLTRPSDVRAAVARLSRVDNRHAKQSGTLCGSPVNIFEALTRMRTTREQPNRNPVYQLGEGGVDIATQGHSKCCAGQG